MDGSRAPGVLRGVLLDHCLDDEPSMEKECIHFVVENLDEFLKSLYLYAETEEEGDDESKPVDADKQHLCPVPSQGHSST